jgi:DNA-binding transcriptional LysR family regulator
LACRSGEAGRVRLGTGATACIYLLPPILAAVRQRMPGLEIIVETGNTPDILRRVELGTLDAGLVTLPTALDRGLVRVKLQRDELAALMPVATAFDGAVTPAQLASQPLILYERGGDTRGIVDAWFRNAGLTPRPIMELGSVEAIKVLVGSGLGASILPCLALDQDVPGARRLALRPATARELGLVMRKEKILDRGMQALTRALELAR